MTPQLQRCSKNLFSILHPPRRNNRLLHIRSSSSSSNHHCSNNAITPSCNRLHLLQSSPPNMKLYSPSSYFLLASTFFSSSSSTLSSNNFVSAFAATPIKMSSTSSTSMPPLTSPAKLITDHIPLANKALSYFDSSPDPFHAVQSTIDILEKAGFQSINDSDVNGDASNSELLQPGGKYYFTKNKSSIVAFAIGKKFDPASSGGFKIIGAHTDSPNLRIKPYSKRLSQGYVQLAVQCYGGGLWHTWFDRDLGLSGRVLTRTKNGTIEQRLVKIDRPVLHIPNLAIHLQSADERKAFAVNKEDHLVPVLSLEVKKALLAKTEGDGSDEKVEDGWVEHQESLLLQLLAKELSVSTSDIVDFELNLFDIQKASLGGVYSEFIHSARLDNLASCFMAVQSLVDYATDDDDSGAALENDQDVSMIALFDHEEVGSSSATGAGSPIMGEAVKRVCNAFYKSNDTEDGNNFVSAYQSCVAKSFVMSVDQAHAIHANYASKHEKNHQPKMNDGVVIKRNANQRYATTGITGFIVREVARKAGLKPVQEFVVRNDCGCGSTIGPIISSNTGIRAIDVGCPQLAMHSIRETMGTCDVTNGYDLFKAFYTHFREIDDSIEGEH